MVERTSQEFRLDTGRESYQGVNLGAGVARRVDAVSPGLVDQALDGLLSVGASAAKKVTDYKAQEAYLQGSRARMAGEAEAAVDSDVFSKPFVRGGYQDEDYRISQAEMAAEMTAFIQTTGQAMSPSEFSKVLQERASKFTPSFDSLSMRGKLQALQSQQAMEASLFAKQATAYQKWSIAEGSKRFVAQGNQIMTDLLQANDPATRPAQLERAALFYTDLLTSDKLPEAARVEMATQYLGALANSDQRDVIAALRDNGALDLLPFDERKKLDTAMRDSEARTRAVDSLDVVMQNGQFESAVATGDVTADSLETYIRGETEAGRMTYQQGKNLRMRFVTGLADKDNVMEVMTALGNRDLNQLASLGFTGQDALELADKQLAKGGKTLQERLGYALTIGSDVGALPKSVGETVGMAVRATQSADPNVPMNEQLVGTLNSVVSTIALAEQKNPSAAGVLLSALPDDTRAAMSYALTQQRNGVAPADAFREFSANREAFAKLDALEQTFQTEKFKKAANKLVEAETTNGIFGTLGNLLTGQSQRDASLYHQNAYASQLQLELGAITQDRANMGMSPESALEHAKANIANRSIEVGAPGVLFTGESRSRLFMPDARSVELVFGTTDKQAIGQTLATEYKAPEGFTSAFTFNRATGRLEQQVIDPQTQRVVDVRRVDPRAVGEKITQRQEAVFEEARAAHFGKPIQLSGQEFRVDGGNSYGIPVRMAYRFRTDIANFEDLRLQVYKDRDGLAVGVGRNVTGTGLKEGDSITKAQAEQWFREDTDTAMAIGTRVGRDLGVTDPMSLAALSGAAFQLGEAGLRKHERTAEAIRNRDYNSFVKEVRSSEWAKQTPKRAEWFINRMTGHFTVDKMNPARPSRF